MTKYLITFPSDAMGGHSDEELQAASEASRSVRPSTRASPRSWSTQAQTRELDGGFCVLELPSHELAVEWAAKLARSCRCAQELRAFHFDPAS